MKAVVPTTSARKRKKNRKKLAKTLEFVARGCSCYRTTASVVLGQSIEMEIPDAAHEPWPLLPMSNDTSSDHILLPLDRWPRGGRGGAGVGGEGRGGQSNTVGRELLAGKRHAARIPNIVFLLFSRVFFFSAFDSVSPLATPFVAVDLWAPFFTRVSLSAPEVFYLFATDAGFDFCANMCFRISKSVIWPVQRERKRVDGGVVVQCD